MFLLILLGILHFLVCHPFSKSINLILVFPRVFWYIKEDFGITIYVLLAKSSRSHSNPAKFSVLNAFGLTIPTPLVVKRFTTSSTFIFTLLFA